MIVREPITASIRRRDRKRAAKALGRPLKPSEHVHHHSLTQLVICQDAAYHGLLHHLERIKRYGGNPRFDRICQSCQSPRRFADFPTDPTAFRCCSYCQLAWNLEQAICAVNLRLYGTRYGLATLLLPAAYPAIWADGSTKPLPGD